MLGLAIIEYFREEQLNLSEIKPAFGLNRENLRDVIPLKTPYSIYFFPTNLCNFRCRYCAHFGGLKQFEKEYGLKAESMSLETFKRTIDQLKDFSNQVKVINLSGQGEPLLNKQLPEMIAYAKESKVAKNIEIITNASLFCHELSKRLIDSGIDTIRISLQGMNNQKYKDICGFNLDFNKLVSEIEYLYSIKGSTSVFVKVMDIALEEGEEELFYKTFGTISDRMYIEQCKPVYDSVEMTQNIETETDRYGRKHEHRDVCPLPFYMLGILPDGTVSPCETIYVPITLGNIWTESIIEMWNGKKMQDFQTMQLRKKRYMNPQCARCCAPDDVSHPEDNLD